MQAPAGDERFAPAISSLNYCPSVSRQYRQVDSTAPCATILSRSKDCETRCSPETGATRLTGLARLGILHQTTLPYSPYQNGKQEVLWGSVEGRLMAMLEGIDVSFAALTMRDDLHMSASAYGFALGTFYWAYFIFEVPSNIVMEKVGGERPAGREIT